MSDENAEPPSPPEPPRPPSAGVDALERLARKTQIARDVFTIVAFAAAGIWALSTFWYRSRWLPEHESALLSGTFTLDRIGVKDDLVAMRARFTVKNNGKGVQKVWGYQFNAAATRVFADPDAGFPDPPAGDALNWYVNRDMGSLPPDVISAQGSIVVPPSDMWFEPSEESVQDFYFVVDRSRYDAVQASLKLLLAQDRAHAKPEWFARERKSGALIIAPTESCRRDDACRYTQPDWAARAILWENPR